MIRTSELLKCYGNKLVHEIAADQTPARVLSGILHDAVKNDRKIFSFRPRIISRWLFT